MPKFTASEKGNARKTPRCPGFLERETAFLAVSSGEAGATRLFPCAVAAGARLAWQRYRAGVRGMARDCGSRSAQIGLAGTPTAGCVGLTGRRGAGQRRPKGRVCWQSYVRQHEHEAGGLQQIQALSTLTTWSCPVHPIRGTRPIDATNNNHRPTAAQQRAGRRRGRSSKEVSHLSFVQKKRRKHLHRRRPRPDRGLRL